MEKIYKIAVVEDDEPLNLSLVRILKKANYQVKGYLNAENLYNDLKIDPQLFDIILCDHILPGMKGLEFYKKLKKEDINTNFIIITGLNDLSLAIESIKS
ncbi:MAG: response regulator, partial [Thermoanaerobaculia bacterium]